MFNRILIKYLSSSLAKNALTYLSANILYASIPFLLLPILTRHLQEEEYGLVAMFWTFVSALGALVGVNTYSFAGRKFFDKNVSEGQLKESNTAIIIILILSALVLLLVIVFLHEKINILFGLSKKHSFMALVTSTFLFITTFRLTHWQVRKMAWKYGLVQISQALMNFTFSVIMVVALNKGAEGRIDAFFLSSITFGIISLIFLIKENLISFHRPKVESIKEALSFGAPLIIHVGGTFLLVAADRLIININLSLKDVGIYMVAIQFSLVLNVIFSAINKAYVPYLFEGLSKEDPKIKLKLTLFTLKYYFGLLFVMILGAFLSPIVLKLIVDVRFHASAELVGLLVIGQSFFGAYLMITNYLFYIKRTGILASITVFCGLLNLALTYYLTIKIGLKGAAISFVIAMSLRFLLTFVVSNRLYKMPWLLATKIIFKLSDTK